MNVMHPDFAMMAHSCTKDPGLPCAKCTLDRLRMYAMDLEVSVRNGSTACARLQDERDDAQRALAAATAPVEQRRVRYQQARMPTKREQKRVLAGALGKEGGVTLVWANLSDLTDLGVPVEG